MTETESGASIFASVRSIGCDTGFGLTYIGKAPVPERRSISLVSPLSSGIRTGIRGATPPPTRA